MFRKMNRSRQQLSHEDCKALLQHELRGVLSVNGDGGYPYALPINHYYCEEDGKLYFHSGKSGHKIDAIMRDGKASFCVYDSGVRREGDWALTIRSVIVFGHIEIVANREEVYRISRLLALKFTQDEDYIAREIAQSGPGTLMFALVPEHISGKTVHEA